MTNSVKPTMWHGPEIHTVKIVLSKKEKRARKKARGRTPRCPVCGITMESLEMSFSGVAIGDPTVIDVSYRMWVCSGQSTHGRD